MQAMACSLKNHTDQFLIKRATYKCSDHEFYLSGMHWGVVGASEAKKALYHCNYCNKDISGTIRIKCNKCPDFDLCVECFSVGVEITPHKSHHSYRVIVSIQIKEPFIYLFFQILFVELVFDLCSINDFLLAETKEESIRIYEYTISL